MLLTNKNMHTNLFINCSFEYRFISKSHIKKTRNLIYVFYTLYVYIFKPKFQIQYDPWFSIPIY